MLARSSALVSCVSKAVFDKMVGVIGTRLATGSSMTVRGVATLQSRLPQVRSVVCYRLAASAELGSQCGFG